MKIFVQALSTAFAFIGVILCVLWTVSHYIDVPENQMPTMFLVIGIVLSILAPVGGLLSSYKGARMMRNIKEHV